jgi:hypothetical protein
VTGGALRFGPAFDAAAATAVVEGHERPGGASDQDHRAKRSNYKTLCTFHGMGTLAHSFALLWVHYFYHALATFHRGLSKIFDAGVKIPTGEKIPLLGEQFASTSGRSATKTSGLALFFKAVWAKAQA